MVSSDEESGLVKGGDTSTKDPLDPKNDPELVKNGGKFDRKECYAQVTWRFPIDPNPLNLLALLYGYLPFVVPVVFFVDMVVEWRFMAFYGLAVTAAVTILNEVVLKPLLKQPRPEGSAHRKFNEKTGKWEMKPGMPSGHVFNATTTMVWCLLEVALRGPGFDDQPFLTSKILLLILVCMGPVPWARVYNQDHSVEQVTVAGICGVIAGILAYWIRSSYFPLEPGNEWCYHKLCLTGGKPWDPFLDGQNSGPLVAAATATTTLFEGAAKEAAKVAAAHISKAASSAAASVTAEAEEASDKASDKVEKVEKVATEAAEEVKDKAASDRLLRRLRGSA